LPAYIVIAETLLPSTSPLPRPTRILNPNDSKLIWARRRTMHIMLTIGQGRDGAAMMKKLKEDSCSVDVEESRSGAKS
jgi:hypothetical protein